MVDCSLNKGHRSGGLVILWSVVIQVVIIQSNKMLIDTYITSSNFNTSWYATGMYGYPITSKKHLTCNTSKDLYQQRIDSKWILFGDFNLILNSSEKLGGNNLDYNLTNMFNETLNVCDLHDLGYHGSKYAWANNQAGQSHIKERLDKYCANSNWISFFPRYINKHLLKYTSDHCPILLEFQEVEDNRGLNTRGKIKRFENKYLGSR